MRLISFKQNSELGSLFLYLQSKPAARNVMIAFLALMVLSSCSNPIEPIVLSGPTMGTQYRVTVLRNATSAETDEQLHAAIKQAMELVNQSMSTYIPDSELSLFNKMPAGGSIVMSPQLFNVMQEAVEISELSSGAFDTTIGKAIRLWGFSEDGRITEKPSTQLIEEIKQSVGYEKLTIEGTTLTKSASGLEVNLSAIAKGYAVDLVAEAIEGLGYTNFLVNIGGELRASGTNTERVPWRVGVERPHLLGGIEQVVELRDRAIATSGDYRNFIEIDGKRYSHTIDSKSLTPVFHRLASVSVLADRASTADALATALLAMGEQRGVEFALKNDIAAYFIIRDDNEENYKVTVTDAFKVNLAE